MSRASRRHEHRDAASILWMHASWWAVSFHGHASRREPVSQSAIGDTESGRQPTVSIRVIESSGYWEYLLGVARCHRATGSQAVACWRYGTLGSQQGATESQAGSHCSLGPDCHWQSNAALHTKKLARLVVRAGDIADSRAGDSSRAVPVRDERYGIQTLVRFLRRAGDSSRAARSVPVASRHRLGTAGPDGLGKAHVPHV